MKRASHFYFSGWNELLQRHTVLLEGAGFPKEPGFPNDILEEIKSFL